MPLLFCYTILGTKQLINYFWLRKSWSPNLYFLSSPNVQLLTLQILEPRSLVFDCAKASHQIPSFWLPKSFSPSPYFYSPTGPSHVGTFARAWVLLVKRNELKRNYEVRFISCFQITRTRKDALEGKALPSDFRLSPIRGRSGPRAAWGGEIGGVRISDRALSVSPVTSEIQIYQGNMRIDSADTSGSLGSASIEIR